MMKFLVLAPYAPEGRRNLQRENIEGNHNIKSNSQTLEVEPYQFGSLIEVMVAHIHLVLSHALVGPLIQATSEGDGVFLLISHRR